MKRSNKICLLLGILVAVCAATLGVLGWEEKKEQIKNSDEIILEVPGESVQSLSWEQDSRTLAFHRDEKWLYDGDEAFPVDEEKIGELLGLFEEFGVSFIIEDVEDYGQYGLENPVCTIHLETEEESYEISLGNYSTMDSERYVSIGDGNVYLVKTDPLDYFDIELSDVIDHDDIPAFDQVSEIRFSGSENYTVVYEEDSANTYCEDDVYFTEDDSLPLDTSRVKSYLKTVSNLDPTDYVTYKVSEEELAEYGLDSPELTLSVDYTDETEEDEEVSGTFVLSVSRSPEEIKEAEKKAEEETEEEKSEEKTEEEEDEEEITAYARVGESPIVYKISGDNYKAIMAASYDSLRHLEVLSADLADVSQIDVSLEGEEYSFTSTKKGDERIYSYLEEELETDELQNSLKALKADSFTDEKPQQKEEIGLTVYLDNENYPKVTIQLYRYDGSHCLAVVDGKPVSLVSRTQVVDLIEAVNEIVLN